MVSWPEAGANVAFLARGGDTNGDGRITSGKELLGSATYADVHNGCNALMTMFKRSGEELSGSVHDGHELSNELVLWTDRNRNGRTDRGELTPARELFTAVRWV